jgi:XcyI restriction endonuclease
MAKKIKDKTDSTYKAWYLDQLAKSAFFHQKLQEWQLVTVAEQIEQVKGEKLTWDKKALGISANAWNKMIHSGIKPIVVFAHPVILQQLSGATAYYRMLAMVSQKSMSQIGGSVVAYERGEKQPDETSSAFLAVHFNQIVSHLIESESFINARAFDIWRGMAAGAQAQGSWQNAKGNQAEILIRGMIEKYGKEKDLIQEIAPMKITLKNGQVFVFSSEPDVAVFKENQLQFAIEVKGGIDAAAVLERIGAAIKSLQRAKEENPKAVTILIMQEVAFSNKALKDIELSKEAINELFMLEKLVEDEIERMRFFNLLNM